MALGVIGGPELLLLDEPTTGFDPAARRQFRDLVRLLADEGTTILLATHYLEEAEALADRLAIVAAGRVVADAASGPQAEALAAELRPDIVLMDLRMPGGAGVDAIVRMSEAGLPCRVVVLTTYENGRDILRAVEAGAAGYLLRGQLADAVRAAARRETVLASSVAARLVDRLRVRPERPRLSEREVAVPRPVTDGCTNAEIGRRLFIGESTVMTHLPRAFAELGVDDRTAAVTRAMRFGLLD
ncbi:response regulator [Streptomyces sp. NPDC048279]|uniref:response regulator n=1 Tax=Streptomyces sp. NPDC048279 TaxID=3154714 RepID=UPI00343499A2